MYLFLYLEDHDFLFKSKKLKSWKTRRTRIVEKVRSEPDDLEDEEFNQQKKALEDQVEGERFNAFEIVKTKPEELEDEEFKKEMFPLHTVFQHIIPSTNKFKEPFVLH